MSETILLKKFSANLNTRPLADEIFSNKKDGDDLVIDFNGVESVTPSFCHEMLVVLHAKKVRIRFANFNNETALQIRKALNSLK